MRMCMKIGIVLTFWAVSLNVVQAQNGWRVLENAPSAGRFEDVFFITPQIGWIIHISGEVFRTDDGGETWQNTFSAPGSRFRSIGFADSLRGWIGLLSGDKHLWETQDGGFSWAPVDTILGTPIEGICGISVVNDSVVYGAGRFDGPPRVIKTTDGGKTWRSISMKVHANTLVDCYFFTPDSGFVVGGSNLGQFPNSITGVVLFTADGGETWQPRVTTTLENNQEFGEWCWKISFANRKSGFVSIERASQSADAALLRTEDGGLNWEKVIIRDEFRVQGIGMITANLGWVGGGTETYETLDGGATWQRASAFPWRNLNRFRFFGDSLGYAVGNQVYKYEAGTATSVKSEKPAAPQHFSLEANYPNPFNPSTNIVYSLSRAGQVRLEIFNLVGERAATLVDGWQQAGHFEVAFDGTGLPSGLFYYRLQVGNFSQTRKMLLLK